MTEATTRLELIAGGTSRAGEGEPRDGQATAGNEPIPSLEALYRAHAGAIGAIGLRILGRRSEADDLVQDVFIAAHDGLHQLNSAKAARSWLSTIAVRLALKRLKKRRRNPFTRPSQLEDLPEVPSEGLSPDQRAELANLYRVLDTLRPDERVAWVLRHVEQHTLPQVAQLSGCSLATAKRRIAAAQRAIALAFDHAPEGDSHG